MRPTSYVIATELDEISYHHAKSTLDKNSIHATSVKTLRASSSQPILFPLLEDAELKVDFTICNPPFFGSEEEMKAGSEAKVDGAHAAPTAAGNELITDGGEVGFVSRMIKESFDIGERCTWFTSLIGKYASLEPLVKLLHERKCDNYFILTIRPSRTARWIIGWSHGPHRLPDRITRPVPIMPHTSFAKLIPPSNTVRHTPDPPISVEQLRQAVMPVLQSINLLPITTSNADISASTGTAASDSTTGVRSHSSSSPPGTRSGMRMFGEKTIEELDLVAYSNTWSRAARRQAARAAAEASNPSTKAEVEMADQGEPIFQARLRLITKLPSTTNTAAKSSSSSFEETPLISGGGDVGSPPIEVTAEGAVPLPQGSSANSDVMQDVSDQFESASAAQTSGVDADPTQFATDQDPDSNPTGSKQTGAAAAIAIAAQIPLPPAASLEIEWTYGRDRPHLDGMWKFLLIKAELIGHTETGLTPVAAAGASADQASGGAGARGGRGRGDASGRGGWRGDSGGRGRGRGNGGRGGESGAGGRGRGGERGRGVPRERDSGWSRG